MKSVVRVASVGPNEGGNMKDCEILRINETWGGHNEAHISNYFVSHISQAQQYKIGTSYVLSVWMIEI